MSSKTLNQPNRLPPIDTAERSLNLRQVSLSESINIINQAYLTNGYTHVIRERTLLSISTKLKNAIVEIYDSMPGGESRGELGKAIKAVLDNSDHILNGRRRFNFNLLQQQQRKLQLIAYKAPPLIPISPEAVKVGRKKLFNW
jgi:hypothetical protein